MRSLRSDSPRRPVGRGGAPARHARWSRPAASSTAPTTCRCRATRSTPDDAYAVTADFADALNVVPRTAVLANDVVVGQVTDVERVGWHARVKFLVRKDIKLPGERRGRRTPDQPAGREVHRPGRAGPGYGERRAALRRRLHPALAHQPQPGGRGGPRRPVDAAERRRHRPAQDDQPRAEQDDERPQDQARHLLGNLDRMIGGLDDQKNDIIAAMESIDRLSADAGQGEGRHRRGHRQHGAGAEGAQPPARGADDDAAPARQARRGRHPGAQRQHATTSSRRCGTCSPRSPSSATPATPWRSGLSMLASFPFPREAGNIARGDYANALFHMDIDLNKIIKSPGENLPNVINLCSALPLAPACEALSPVLKATVCAGRRPTVRRGLLCPPGSQASNQAPLTIPDLGLTGSAARQPRARQAVAAVSAACSASGVAADDPRREDPADRVPRAQRRRHRSTSPAASSGSPTGCWAAGSPSTPPCPRPVACSPAARSPTAASRSARSPRWTSPARGCASTSPSRTGTKIPLDSKMHVHNLSAVGEQYLDFEPPDNKPAVRRRAGDVIKGDESSLPTSEELLLTQMDSLVGSVDGAELSTVVGEAGTMFRGTAEPAAADGRLRVRSSSTRRPRTPTPPSRCWTPGAPCCRPRPTTRQDIRAFARDLADLTGTLRTSDKNLRTILQGGAPAVREVDSLLKGLEPTLPVFLSNLVTINQVLTANLPALEQMLVVFPHVIAAGLHRHARRRLRPHQPAVQQQRAAVHEGLQAAVAVAPGHRHHRRADLPGPVPVRAAPEHARLQLRARSRVPPRRPAAPIVSRTYDARTGAVDTGNGQSLVVGNWRRVAHGVR